MMVGGIWKGMDLDLNSDLDLMEDYEDAFGQENGKIAPNAIKSKANICIEATGATVVEPVESCLQAEANDANIPFEYFDAKENQDQYDNFSESGRAGSHDNDGEGEVESVNLGFASEKARSTMHLAKNKNKFYPSGKGLGKSFTERQEMDLTDLTDDEAETDDRDVQGASLVINAGIINAGISSKEGGGKAMGRTDTLVDETDLIVLDGDEDEGDVNFVSQILPTNKSSVPSAARKVISKPKSNFKAIADPRGPPVKRDFRSCRPLNVPNDDCASEASGQGSSTSRKRNIDQLGSLARASAGRHSAITIDDDNDDGDENDDIGSIYEHRHHNDPDPESPSTPGPSPKKKIKRDLPATPTTTRGRSEPWTVFQYIAMVDTFLMEAKRAGPHWGEIRTRIQRQNANGVAREVPVSQIVSGGSFCQPGMEVGIDECKRLPSELFVPSLFVLR